MFVGYLMLLAGVFAFLPLAVKASGTCTPPDHVINAVTQKAENGSALCATSPPTETLAANFKILCLGACMKRPSCEHGFNYRSEAELCELYRYQPTSFYVQPDCSYLMARRCSYGYFFVPRLSMCLSKINKINKI